MRYAKIVVVSWLFVLLSLTITVYAKSNSNVPGARFENISLVDFIKFVSAKTGQSITYSQRSIPMSAKITLYSPNELTNRDLMKIFYSVLKENRLVPVKEGSTILIVRSASVRDIGSKYVTNVSKPPNTLSTVIIKLKNISVDKLGVSLRHLVSPYGSLDIIPALNVVVVTDTKDRIKQVGKLLRAMDSSNKIITKLVSIKNASSNRVASELNKFFIELKRKKGSSYSPVVLSEDESNSLIIAARKSDFVYIQSLVDDIIKKTESQKSQKVFYLKNAVAKDVYTVIVKLLSKTPAFKNTSISYDEATNSIIVLGTPSIYNRVSSLIARLDVPRKQVYIEALIVETSLTNLSEFGVEWSGIVKSHGSIGYLGNSNTGDLGNLEKSIVGDGNLAPLPNGFSLGILGNVVSYNGVKFATLGALLNALKSKDNINIVSNPKIVTLDNQKANIFVGENRPYLTSKKYDTNGNPIYTYDYKDVGVKLTILPHVNGKKIIMDTKLDVKNVSEDALGGDSLDPVTFTRSTSTKIALDSGDKILISGLIENDKETREQKVPVLSSIPVLGGLFKYKKTNAAKTNLLIFLSVKIINNQKDIDNFDGTKNGKN